MPTTRPVPPRAFDALVLTGGGLTGAVWHLAVLAALEERVEGFDPAGFPVYLGSSAGATVAALVAGGIPPGRLHASLRDRDGFFPVRREHFFPAGRVGLTRSLLRLVARAVAGFYGRNGDRPREGSLPPPGLFHLRAYEKFLAGFLRRSGLPTRFDRFPRRLLVPAFDLDAARTEILGRGSWAGVSVPAAVCASSAIPLLYAPVPLGGRWLVDGDTGGANHLDVLLEEGCRRFLVIHPVVPLRAEEEAGGPAAGVGAGGRIHEGGMLAVWNQSNRAMTRGRLGDALRRQLAAHPDMEVALVEPPTRDAEMFRVNTMNFDRAPSLGAYARETVLARLDAAGWEAFDARRILGVPAADLPKAG